MFRNPIIESQKERIRELEKKLEFANIIKDFEVKEARANELRNCNDILVKALNNLSGVNKTKISCDDKCYNDDNW